MKVKYWEVASVLLNELYVIKIATAWYFCTRRNWHAVIAFIISSISMQFTNGFSSLTVNFFSPLIIVTHWKQQLEIPQAYLIAFLYYIRKAESSILRWNDSTECGFCLWSKGEVKNFLLRAEWWRNMQRATGDESVCFASAGECRFLLLNDVRLLACNFTDCETHPKTRRTTERLKRGYKWHFCVFLH